MAGKKTIGQPLPAQHRIRPSDVIAIPLNENEWGYARILNNQQMAVFRLRTKGMLELKDVIGTPLAFYVEYHELYGVSPWVYLGKWKFGSEDEAWGPATYFRDKYPNGVITLLKRGQVIRGVTEEDIVGLSRQGLSSPNMIKEMILSKISPDEGGSVGK